MRAASASTTSVICNVVHSSVFLRLKVLSVSWAGLLLLLVHPSAGYAQGPRGSAPQQHPPEGVVVVVQSLGSVPDEVDIAYPGGVSEREAFADFATLCNLGNRPYQDPVFRIFPASGRGEMGQLVGYIPGFVDRTSGRLPLDELVFVLRRFPTMTANFLVDSPFFYTGPTKRNENRYVVVDPAPITGSNSFTFHVTIKDPNFDFPGEIWRTDGSMALSQSAPPVLADRGGQNRVRSYIILAVAALGAGGATFASVYLWRIRRKGSRESGR